VSSSVSPSNRRNRSISGSAVEVLYLVLIVAIPATVSKQAYSQEILKATIFVLLVLLLVTLRSYRAVAHGSFESGPRLLSWATVAFISALLVTTIFSAQQWVALTGAPGRGMGAISYMACLAVFHGVFRDFRHRSVEPLLTAFLVAHAVVGGYALVQAYGGDPNTWMQQMAFGGFVSSTLGNPNFSSAFLAISLPLLVRCQFILSYHPAFRVVTAVALAVSLAAIAFMDSFQSQLAVLTALFVPAVWVFQHRGQRRLEAMLHVAPMAATIVVLPVLLSGSVPRLSAAGIPEPVSLTGDGSLILAATMIILGGWTWMSVLRQERWSTEVNETYPTGRPDIRWRRWLVGALGSGAFLVVLAWPMVEAQVTSGFSHRREMWIVSLKILRNNPLFGTGLETYYSYFSPLRPVEHAVRYEGLISDNPHSVFLNMFNSGGLLLGGSYLALLLVIGVAGLRALLRTAGSERLVVGAVLAGWAAYHVQSSVSIDVVGLAYTQWVLAGVLLARSDPEDLRVVKLPWNRTGPVGTDRKTRIQSRARQHRSTVLQRHTAIVVGVVVVLVLLGPVTAPLRADFLNRDANVAFLEGNLALARDQMESAINLEPRNGRYAETLGRIYVRAGDLKSALVELERSAQLRPGYADIERLAALINRDNDNTERAIYWYEQAITSEPYGPFGLKQIAEYYASIGESHRLYERLARYEELNLGILNPVIADTYEALGDEENAERVRRG
jgi:hypothetical protein